MPANTFKHDKITLMFTFFMVHGFSSLQLFYLPLFLEDGGMDKGQIGILVSVGTLFAAIGQFVWSAVADKSRSVNIVLLIISACAVATLPIYILSTGFLGYAVAIGSYNFFIAASYPLSDSICLYYNSGEGKPEIQFGRIRLMGSLGFLLMMIIGSITIGYYVGSIFILQAISGLILLIAIRMAPKVTMPKMKKVAFNPIPVIRKPSVMATLLLGFFMYTATGIHGAFFTPYFINDLGAPSYILSFVYVFSISVEVVFFFNMNRLMQKFNIKTLFFMAALLMAVRWTIFGLSSHYIFLIIFNALDGIVLVALTGYTSIYFKAIAPPEGKVSMQSINYLVNYCIAKGVGGLIGAPIMNAVGGMKNTYLTMGIAMFVVSILFIISPVKFLDLRKNLQSDKKEAT